MQLVANTKITKLSMSTKRPSSSSLQFSWNWIILYTITQFAGIVKSQSCACCSQLAAYNVTTEWIDRTTPNGLCTRSDGKILVFSDEFTTTRGLGIGADTKWQSQNLYFYSNPTTHLENYKPEAVSITTDGVNKVLKIEATLGGDTADLYPSAPTFSIRSTGAKIEDTYGKRYKSGAINGWNKFCFTGGYIEARVKLAGTVDSVGVWPSISLVGNLARWGYIRSMEGVYPWSYNTCDVETYWPQNVQLINKCSATKGRGSPHIDLLEVAISSAGIADLLVGTKIAPVMPIGTHWFPNTTLFSTPGSALNLWPGVIPKVNNAERPGTSTYDIIQAKRSIDNTYFTAYHTYGLDWKPNGWMTWYLDGAEIFSINTNLPPASNTLGQTVGERPTSLEPMYINLAVSLQYFPNNPEDFMDQYVPTAMMVDYMRVYQDPAALNLGCSPPGFETATDIACNVTKYKFNTVWEEPMTGFNIGACPYDMTSKKSINIIYIIIPVAVVGGLVALLLAFLLYRYCVRQQRTAAAAPKVHPQPANSSVEMKNAPGYLRDSRRLGGSLNAAAGNQIMMNGPGRTSLKQGDTLLATFGSGRLNTQGSGRLMTPNGRPITTPSMGQQRTPQGNRPSPAMPSLSDKEEY